jgi:hypothetical protein
MPRPRRTPPAPPSGLSDHWGEWHEDWSDAFAEYEPRIDLTGHLHRKQLAFHLDPSPIRVVHGTRRSGKSEGLCIEAIEIADQFPGETIPYIMPTIAKGADVVFPKFEELGNRFGLGLKITRGDYKVRTPSGGVIQMFGLATEPEVEKGRGPRFPMVVIDECGAQRQDLLKRAVRETFGPATADFRGLGGRGIVLAGTAGYEPDCYWEQLVGSNAHVSKLGASVHFMTIWDNPFFKGREAMILEAHLRDNNIAANDAGYRREWLGEFCADTEGLCYQRWAGALLPRHMIPSGGYTVMGLDLGGTASPSAWVIVRYVVVETVVGGKFRSIHHGHVIASFEKTGCSVEELASITRKLQQAYHVSHIAGDSAGLGSRIVDDMRVIYNLPIVAVKKNPIKAGAIWMVDSQLGAGTLHVHEGCDSVIRQLRTVPWNARRTDHHGTFGDHSLDGLLYASTLSRQHELEHELPPEPGTPEWYKAQEARDEQATIEFARWRQNRAA